MINVASFVAVMGAAVSQGSYTASKGAVLALSRELGVEFAARGVRVNALCPGPVNTPLLKELFAKDPERAAKRLVHVPMGRFGEPEEIATAALFLASDESSFVTATPSWPTAASAPPTSRPARSTSVSRPDAVATRVDYETHGRGYARRRRADPRIAAAIEAALGDARTVLNVGAGAGSYEPRDRWVLAVEPSATMRAQRPADAAPASPARPNRCRSTTTRSTRRWPA